MKYSEELIIKLTTILSLTFIAVVAIVCITVVSVKTDRDVWRAEFLTLVGVILIAMLGGLTWWDFHRRSRWHVELGRRADNNGGNHVPSKD